MDRRVKRTRDLVFEAFGRLLKRKEYSQITVGDILKEANIGRSTFYENFKDKDCVLDEILEDLFNHVFEELFVSTCHFTSATFEEKITHLLIHIKEDQTGAKEFLLGNSNDIFYKRIGTRLADECEHQIKPVTNIPKPLSLAHIASTFSDVLKYWALHNFEEDVIMISSYFIYMIKETISL